MTNSRLRTSRTLRRLAGAIVLASFACGDGRNPPADDDTNADVAPDVDHDLDAGGSADSDSDGDVMVDPDSDIGDGADADDPGDATTPDATDVDAGAPEVGDADAGTPDGVSDFGAPDSPDGAAGDTDAGGDSDTALFDAPDLPRPGALEFVEPADGSFVRAITLIEATGPRSLESVEFLIDDASLRVDLEAPFLALWDAPAAGEGVHVIRAVGDTGVDTEEVSVTVTVDVSAPDIIVFEPGVDVIGPDSVGMLPFDFDVFDAIGVVGASVAIVDAEVEAVRLDVPPWVGEIDASSLPGGIHVLSITAWDAAGWSATVLQPFEICPDEAPIRCGGICRQPGSFVNDPFHCGECETACAFPAEVCDSGSCACAPTRVDCDGACVSLDSDEANCGECGLECTGERECVAGGCGEELPEDLEAIPATTYRFGPAPREPGTETHESAHEVTLTRSFAIEAFEVTQGEWSEYFTVNPSAFWECGEDCPVDSVNWFEALHFANARSEDEGLPPCYILEECDGRPVGAGVQCARFDVDTPDGNPLDCEGYRLPTEAEWEWAYRAGTETSTYAGEAVPFDCEGNPFIDEIAWYECNASGRTHPVGTRHPNGFGLYDMAGNVFEWTGDPWRSYIPPGPLVDPTGAEESFSRTAKGGAWNEHAGRLRASTRLSVGAITSLATVGLRLARTLPDPE